MSLLILEARIADSILCQLIASFTSFWRLEAAIESQSDKQRSSDTVAPRKCAPYEQ